MNETTILLARIMGTTLCLTGLGMVLNAKFYFEIFKDLKDIKLEIFTFGMGVIALGIAVVVNHPFWDSIPAVIINIVGIAMLVKGSFFAILPKMMFRLTEAILSPALLMIGGILWVIGGAYLMWVGFY